MSRSPAVATKADRAPSPLLLAPLPMCVLGSLALVLAPAAATAGAWSILTVASAGLLFFEVARESRAV